MIKSSDKLVPKKAVKKRDRVMKKRDRGKFWTKNRDCPSKSGTVGGYEREREREREIPNIHCTFS